MLRGMLRSAKKWVRTSPLRGPLDRVGLVGLGRRLYNNAVLSSGVHEGEIMGHRLKFAVEAQREITRIDAAFEEAPFVQRILDAARPGTTFYDIGANIGLVSLLVRSSRADDGDGIHAFEPEPRNAGNLRKNLALNGADKARVHQLALGAEAGTAKLHVAGETGMGTHSIVDGHNPGGETIEIAIERADDFAARTGTSPDVAKIDVEGAEMMVVRGMSGLLSSHAIADLFVEVHRNEVDPAAFEALLRSHGYELVWSNERGNELHHHYRVKAG